MQDPRQRFGMGSFAGAYPDQSSNAADPMYFDYALQAYVLPVSNAGSSYPTANPMLSNPYDQAAMMAAAGLQYSQDFAAHAAAYEAALTQMDYSNYDMGAPGLLPGFSGEADRAGFGMGRISDAFGADAGKKGWPKGSPPGARDAQQAMMYANAAARPASTGKGGLLSQRPLAYPGKGGAAQPQDWYKQAWQQAHLARYAFEAAQYGKDTNAYAGAAPGPMGGKGGKMGGTTGKGMMRWQRNGTGSQMDDAAWNDIAKRHAEAYQLAKGPGETDEGVTYMLKNIPNKYTREMLINQLHLSYKGHINFLYMPIDFSTECNVGYAFINFRAPQFAEKFEKEYHGSHTKKCLPGYNSNKIAEVSLAAVQGLQANLDRLKRSPLLPMLKNNEGWQPVMFDPSGSLVAFPCEAERAPRNVGPKGAKQSVGPGPNVGPNDVASGKPGTPRGNTRATAAAENDGYASPNKEAMMSAVVPITGDMLVPSNVGSPQSVNSPHSPVAGHLPISGDTPAGFPLSPTASHDSRSPTSPQSPPRTPKQKLIAANFRGSITRKQLEAFFDPLESGKLLEGDVKKVRSAMDSNGWLPISALVSLKGLTYPGYESMREVIRESKLLEFDGENFRCSDERLREEFLRRA